MPWHYSPHVCWEVRGGMVGLAWWIQKPWDVQELPREASTHVRSLGKTAQQCSVPPCGLQQGLVLSHWLKPEKLIVTAYYNKQQHPRSYFLEIKGRLQRQETPAQIAKSESPWKEILTVRGFTSWSCVSDQSVIESNQHVTARGNGSWSSLLWLWVVLTYFLL